MKIQKFIVTVRADGKKFKSEVIAFSRFDAERKVESAARKRFASFEILGPSLADEIGIKVVDEAAFHKMWDAK